MLIAFVLSIFNLTTKAQEIKFPESFKADSSLFAGLSIAEIPQEAQIKYGVTKNPGLITDPSKAKGFLMSVKLPKVQSIYFEIYKDEEETLSCAFEVAKFASVADLEEVLPKKAKQNVSVILLTINNYLIIVYGPPSKKVGESLDRMSNYFQQKLGAKLIQDRRKEVETSVVDNYVSNLPPPLPPEPKGASTKIALEDLDKRIANNDGLAYMRNKKREKLAPGKYRATGAYPPFETLVFTLNQDSLLNGDYEYHYADDYSKSRSKESKLTFDNGVLVSEIVYVKGDLIGSTTHTVEVVREKNDFLITRNTITKSPKYGTQEMKTVFRNKKPVSKITATLGVSVIRKDFEKRTLEHFNSKGQLTKLKKPGLTEEYDATGKVTYKDEWIGDNHFVYKNGKLITKEIGVKGQQQYLVTEYDENGKVIKEFSRGVEDGIAIANPDEYESDLTEALFEYYKKKASDLH